LRCVPQNTEWASTDAVEAKKTTHTHTHTHTHTQNNVYVIRCGRWIFFFFRFFRSVNATAHFSRVAAASISFLFVVVDRERI
jgi:hypothetical protein